MRYIIKKGEPAALRNWKAANAASPQNLKYGNLPTQEREQVKDSLLIEQGYLCAYSMLRLDCVDDCHIEHIQPQNAAPALDLDYKNMAACFPKNGGDTSHGFGAPIKGGSPVELNVNFVPPHRLGCGDRFKFNAKGEIAAATNDLAADNTIRMIGLCHKTLVELRRSAIEAHGLSLRHSTTRKKAKLKTPTEARRFAHEVLQPDAAGRLEPFCVALAQVALDYAAREEARAQRMRTQHGKGR